ncbi:MAG: hypothetical protein Q9M22_03780 [Mariprofundaceae bacterium]|nr:hypothetical protein [Mariprofundaceae bacterium]
MNDQYTTNNAGTSFQGAVDDALLLLRYATESGINIDDQTLSVIVQVSQDEAIADIATQVSFWRAYEHVSTLLHPITAASLRDCHSPRMTWALSVLTGLLIILVVSFQALWAVGMDLTQKLDNNISELQQITAMDADSTLASEFLKENLTTKGEALLRALSAWNNPLSGSLLFVFNSVTNSNKEVVPSSDNPASQIQDMLIQSKITLEFLQVYILPLLYGMLGAFAYVLRHISFSIRNRTYTHQTLSDYLLRVTMGCISGFVIAWFIVSPAAENDGQTTNMMVSLSPFAIAFIAGYSIELLFSLMDKIISPFITEREGSKKTVAER